jgi:hypothetical protein
MERSAIQESTATAGGAEAPTLILTLARHLKTSYLYHENTRQGGCPLMPEPLARSIAATRIEERRFLWLSWKKEECQTCPSSLS